MNRGCEECGGHVISTLQGKIARQPDDVAGIHRHGHLAGSGTWFTVRYQPGAGWIADIAAC